MEQLLIRTVGTCLQELTDLRNHVRELEAQVHTLSASSTASASTEPPGASKRIGRGRDPRDASSLLHVCGVANETLRELMARACEEGELHFELRDLVRRLREKGDAGAEEPTDFQEVLLAELRAGGISALALTWHRSEGESPKAIVDRSPEGCEAALARSLAAEGEASEGAATVVLVPTFCRATWSLLQAALAFCRKERLPPSLELVHAAMRSLLTADAQFQDVDIIGMMRLAPQGKEATVHVRGGRVVVRVGEDAESGATQVNWGTQPLPMMPTSLVAQLRRAVETLQALGGGSKAAMECNLPWMLPVLRASDFAAQSSLPEAARTATGADLLQACAGKTEWEGNTVSPGLPHPALAPKVSEADLWSQPMQPGEVAQGCQSLSRGSLPVIFGLGDTKSRHSLNSLPGLEKFTSNKSIKSVKSAKSVKNMKSRVSERDSADWDSDAESADGQVPKEITQNILVQQSAFIECFRAELFGQRPLLLSQLNNLYKMRSDQELQYKTAGYEKLREFLMDIPGLSLMGRGNRMQVRLADEAKLEAFMNQTLLPVAQSQGSQGPQFSMPQPLPESLQYCLHQLFLDSPSHEIPLRNFLNVWNTQYPSQPLAYRALGFRDVRALLSQVTFIEKVGSKSEAKYVLKGQDGARGASQVVPAGLVSAQAAPAGAAGDSPLSESEAMPMPDMARTMSTRSDRGTQNGMMGKTMSTSSDRRNSVGQQLASAPLSPQQQQPVRTAPAMPSMPRTSSRAERFASNTSVGFAEEAGGYPSDLQAAPARISSMGSRAEARLREMQQMDLAQAAGPASPSQPLMRQNPRRMDAGGPDELLVADQFQVSDAQREQQARHVLYRTNSGLSTGQLSPMQAGEEEFYSAPMGLSRAVGELLRGVSGSSPTLSPTKAGINPRDIPPRLAPERMGGMANAYGSNGVRNSALHNLGPAFDTGPGLERSLLFMEPRAMLERKVKMSSAFAEADLPEDDIMPLLARSPSFQEPPPGIGEESKHFQEDGAEGMSSADLRREHRRMRAAKRVQGVRLSSTFVSSPGAFSSETRDATLHQGKFDMSSVLQMQLRGKEPPSLVCDIAGLKVLHSNDECVKLFESSCGTLAQAEILSFLGQEDQFKFSQVVAYMIVSNSSKMEPQEMTIVTNRGNLRHVRMEGVQLLGMWWQLDFIALDSDA